MNEPTEPKDDVNITEEEQERRYDEKLAEWDNRLRPETDALTRSEQLTAEDYGAPCAPHVND